MPAFYANPGGGLARYAGAFRNRPSTAGDPRADTPRYSGGGGGGAPGEPPPDPFDESLNPFREGLTAQDDLIAQQQAALAGLGGQAGGIADQFGQFAQGEDPLIAMQRQQQLDQQARQLARSGVTGSAALNQQARTAQGFNQLALGQRNQALMNQAGLLGLQGDFATGQVGLGQTGLQNQLAIPELLVMQEAARNSGNTGGGGGGLFNGLL